MGICNLCLKEKQLVESHLIPRAIYENVKKFHDPDNRDIIIAESEKKQAFYTDKQIKQKALCKECEDRFNKGGENLILQEYLKSPNEFILLERLKSIKPPILFSGEKWFRPQDIADLHPEKYLYFAASIFWRASAIKWKNNSSFFPNALGKTYSELFRTYLLGHTKFPKNAYLTVYVDDASNLSHITAFPVASKTKNFFSHVFMMPGIKFTLLVGKALNISDELYLDSNITFVITDFSDPEKNPEYSLLVNELLHKVQPKGRLTKLFNK